AAAYCNWLSEREGRPSCYVPTDSGEYKPGMRVDASAVAKGAYRLPTESEWEFSCRAGTETSRYFGDAPDLLGRYEWFVGNSGDCAQHCGWRLPNELGLFDMLANVFEWCHDRHLESPPSPGAITLDVIEDEAISDEKRLFRGQMFSAAAPNV